MQTYVIKDYQKGFEKDQASIGYQAAKHWVWPYAYDLDDSSDEYLQHAVQWFNRSPDWCKNLLAEWHEHGIIAHLGVRD